MINTYLADVVHWCIDWTAIGALGEWAGAIGTVVSVYIAFKAFKKSTVPSLKVTLKYFNIYPGLEKNGPQYLCRWVNAGSIDIKVDRAEIEFLPSGTNINLPNVDPIKFQYTVEPPRPKDFLLSHTQLMTFVSSQPVQNDSEIRLILIDTLERVYKSNKQPYSYNDEKSA